MRRYIPSFAAPKGRYGAARVLAVAALATSLAFQLADTTPAAASYTAPVASVTATRLESPDGLIHLKINPGESEARYIMTLRTLGQPPKQAACSTREVSGEVVLTTDGQVLPELSKMVVDQRTLKCQAPLRDNMAQQLLNTAQFQYAEFTVTAAPGLIIPPPTPDITYQLVGEQTVRGVTKPLTYDAQSTWSGDSSVGSSRALIKMSDFGIQPPQIGPLLQVEDTMIAEVDVKSTIYAPAGAPAAGGAPEGEAP